MPANGVKLLTKYLKRGNAFKFVINFRMLEWCWPVNLIELVMPVNAVATNELRASKDGDSILCLLRQMLYNASFSMQNIGPHAF